jgi:hypothetical protein
MVVGKKGKMNATRDMNSKTIWVGDKCNPGDGEKKHLNEIMLQIHGIRDSAVGTETMQRIRRSRVRMPASEKGFFLHQIYFHRLWATEKL